MFLYRPGGGTPSCTVNGTALAGTSWNAATRTLTLPALPLQSGTGRDVQCTFTNATIIDLSITKSNTYTASQPSDLANDTVSHGATTTYTLVVANRGPGGVSGAVVRDTPAAGLTCPGTNAVTITGDGVPAGSFTVADLTGGTGIALARLTSGQSATLSFQCTVN